VLTVGLTGGIGSGKSTAARRLGELGAVVIDADRVAREVVAAGTPGLQSVVDAFGHRVLAADGTLDRAALAGLVFGDGGARARLNAIVHPLVRSRTAGLVAVTPPDAVVVNDVPLLVETGLAPTYHLVVVVESPAEQRVERLVRDRAMGEDDARARIEAQAGDDQRREVADVVLPNTASVSNLEDSVHRLWRDRVLPYAANVRDRRRATRPLVDVVGYDQDWPRQYERLAARIRHVGQDLIGALTIAHIGSTAVPGLAAKDVLDVQVGVPSLEQADALQSALAAAGFPAVPGMSDRAKLPDHGVWPKRFHGSADPGRPANLHLRVTGSPGWRYALLIRDWLQAEPGERAAYEQVKRALAADHPASAAYAEAKEPWFDEAGPRAEAWAARTGWRSAPG